MQRDVADALQCSGNSRNAMGLLDCCHSQICYIIKKQMEMGSAPN